MAPVSEPILLFLVLLFSWDPNSDRHRHRTGSTICVRLALALGLLQRASRDLADRALLVLFSPPTLNSWCPVTICEAKQETNTGPSSPSGTLLFPLHFLFSSQSATFFFVAFQLTEKPLQLHESAEENLITSAAARRQYDAHMLLQTQGKI